MFCLFFMRKASPIGVKDVNSVKGPKSGNRIISRWLNYTARCLTLALVPFAYADERRVTTEVLLPFQQATQSAEASSARPVYQLQSLPGATQSPQTVSHSSASVGSVAVHAELSSAAVLSPVVGSNNRVKAVDQSASLSAQGSSISTQANSQRAAPATAAVSSKPAAAPVKTANTVKDAAAKKIPTLKTPEIKAVTQTSASGQAFVKQFEDYVEKDIAPYVPGVAIAIISQGQVKSLRAFGVRTANTRVMMTPDTVFRLASSSKPVAATAIALYVRKGVLNWESGVTQVLPHVQFKQANHGKNVTLRHLLSQSVGLPTHSNSSMIEAGMSYAESVRRLRLVNFVCPPGKCYAYQNVTYTLAGDMVAKKAGKAFESVVEDVLFGPLGMRSASFGRASYMNSENRATPHIAQGKRWVPTDVTENYYRVPSAAGANASIVDMSRFLMGQLGQRPDVIPTETLNLIQSRVTKNSKEQSHYAGREAVSNTAYGLGWRVFDYGRNKNFSHHGGWVKGFRSEMVFNRQLGIGMVFLTNSESRLARNVIFKFMDLHEMSQQAARAKR